MSLQPNVTSEELNVSSAEPNVTSEELNVSSVEPNVTSAEPSASSAEPNVTSAELNVSSVEPNVTSAEPNVSSEELDVDVRGTERHARRTKRQVGELNVSAAELRLHDHQNQLSCPGSERSNSSEK